MDGPFPIKNATARHNLRANQRHKPGFHHSPCKVQIPQWTNITEKWCIHNIKMLHVQKKFQNVFLQLENFNLEMNLMFISWIYNA